MQPAQLVLIAYLLFFLAHMLVERVLAVMNIRYVRAHGGMVPEPVRATITPETYAKSIDYAEARTAFGHVSAAVHAALKLFFLFSGIIPWLDRMLERIHAAPLTHGVLLLVVFGFMQSILSLPLELYATFRLEARFGFNQTTPRTFWLDRLKGWILGLLLGVPLAYAVLGFIMYTGSLWWLWASLFVLAFQFVMMIVYPLWIAPLFNKFTPLAEGELKRRLEDLARHCRFAAGGIFVMDGSRRSAHSNAYFTGFGKGRRIVLFDTLIQQMNVEELAAVLAHEIGHYKKKHIAQRLALAAVLLACGFFLLSVLLNWPPLYAAFGMPLSVPAGVLLFELIVPDFTFWAGPLFSALSRKHEYEADAYAAQQAAAAPMSSALVKLSEKNLATLTPHPLYSAYHYSHPTLLERLGALQREC